MDRLKSLKEQIKEVNKNSKSKNGWRDVNEKEFDHYLWLLNEKDKELNGR